MLVLVCETPVYENGDATNEVAPLRPHVGDNRTSDPTWPVAALTDSR